MEEVVQSDAQDVVGDLGAPAINSAEVRVMSASAYSPQVDVEVFNFPAPVRRIWNDSLAALFGRTLKIGLKAEDLCRISLPIVTNLSTANQSIQALCSRKSGRKIKRRINRVAETGVTQLYPNVAPDIKSGPAEMAAA